MLLFYAALKINYSTTILTDVWVRWIPARMCECVGQLRHFEIYWNFKIIGWDVLKGHHTIPIDSRQIQADGLD